MASNENEFVEIDDSIENIEEHFDENDRSENEIANNSAVNSDGEVDESEGGAVVGDDLPFEFTVGMTANSKLIFTTVEKQLYRRDNKYGDNGSYYYRCNIRGCRVRLFYNAQQNKCSRKKSTPHTHPAQEKAAKVAKLRKTIKDECAQMAGSSKRNKTSVNEVISTNIRK